ncbi:putative kynurenine 3-monooxygenase [Calothrix sp. NIES-4071]|nr:putative kynurenine 3-monooxygenase [Calothrix sp. NIES-4071]BAZ64236.1 putative kynurenine 3-monooxygenase [Calothrix sp. NIES-4105]
MGQGCNAAFEDVVIFNTLLDEYLDNWAEALPQFTLRRKPDAHALVELSDNASPMSGTLLFYEFFIRIRFGQILHQLFPKRFPKPLFQLASETTIPYSEILNTYQNWITRVKRSNKRQMVKSFRLEWNFSVASHTMLYCFCKNI